MIAIVCILSAGFMLAAPFVQIADAAEIHYITVYEIRVHVCAECGATIAYEVVRVRTIIIIHGADDDHTSIHYSVRYVVVEVVVHERCDSCENEESSS